MAMPPHVRARAYDDCLERQVNWTALRYSPRLCFLTRRARAYDHCLNEQSALRYNPMPCSGHVLKSRESTISSSSIEARAILAETLWQASNALYHGGRYR